MSTPKSLLSYQDCLDYFDTALRFTEGCRIPVRDVGDAYNFRMRLNNCRKLHREENARIYPEHNIMHGKSPYDCIVIKIKAFGPDDDLYVVLERIDISRRKVEGMGEPLEDEGYEPIEQAQAPLQIEGPRDDELDEGSVVPSSGLRRI